MDGPYFLAFSSEVSSTTLVLNLGAQVPEPSSLVLAGQALAGVVAVQRRRGRRLG